MREDLKQKRKEMRPKAKKGGVEVEIVGLTPELEAMASGDYSGSATASNSADNFSPDG